MTDLNWLFQKGNQVDSGQSLKQTNALYNKRRIQSSIKKAKLLLTVVLISTAILLSGPQSVHAQSSQVLAPAWEPEPEIYGQWETVLPRDDGAAVGSVLGMQSVHNVLLPSGKVLMTSGSSWRNRSLGLEYYPDIAQPDGGKGVFVKQDSPFEKSKLEEYYSIVNNTGIYDPEQNTFYRIPHPVPVQDPDNPDWFAPNDLFCTSHMHLPDGNVLFAGGTQYYSPYRTGVKTSYIFDWKKEMGIPWAQFNWTQIPDDDFDPCFGAVPGRLDSTNRLSSLGTMRNAKSCR